MKTYDIEVQRLKAMRHETGQLVLNLDALIVAKPPRDDGTPSSSFRVSVEDARTLLILLKQQLAELDKLQPRSRRSGRC